MFKSNATLKNVFWDSLVLVLRLRKPTLEISFRFVCYRLDDIACDAELQEKSESELRKLGELLQSSCEQALKDFSAKKEEETPSNDGKLAIV